MNESEAISVLEKFTVDGDLNLPNPIETKEDFDNVVEACRIARPEFLKYFETIKNILDLSEINSEDYSNYRYKLELENLSENENQVLTDFLKKNLPESAETYGTAVMRMIDGKFRKPEDVDIQLHLKDELLAEKLAKDACDTLNKLSVLDKFEVSTHDPQICLLPSRTRKSVVRLKKTGQPVLDIHIDGEEGSIPKSVFGHERLLPVMIDGMKVSPRRQLQLDKASSVCCIRRQSSLNP